MPGRESQPAILVMRRQRHEPSSARCWQMIIACQELLTLGQTIALTITAALAMAG